jgi:hypothetical protein
MVEPGIYPDMPDAEYFALPYASKSKMWRVHSIPETVRNVDEARRYLNAPITGYHLDFGRAFDDAMQRSPDFTSKYAVGPTKTEGSKAWKKAQSENPDITYLKEDDIAMLPNMVDSVLSHDIAGPMCLSEKAKWQVVVVWDDPATGIRCKGKIDLWTAHRGQSTHADFKTWIPKRRNMDYSRAFGFEAEDYGYPLQVCHYLDGCGSLDELRGRPRFPRRFILIVVNKKPEDWDETRHAVFTTEYREDQLEGWLRVRDKLLTQWQSIQDGTWKPKPPQIHGMYTHGDAEKKHGDASEYSGGRAWSA